MSFHRSTATVEGSESNHPGRHWDDEEGYEKECEKEEGHGYGGGYGGKSD